MIKKKKIIEYKISVYLSLKRKCDQYGVNHLEKGNFKTLNTAISKVLIICANCLLLVISIPYLGRFLTYVYFPPTFFRQKFPWEGGCLTKIIKWKFYEPRWDNIWRWLITWLQLIVCGTWKVSNIFKENPFTCPSKEVQLSLRISLLWGATEKYFWGNLAPASVFLFFSWK